MNAQIEIALNELSARASAVTFDDANLQAEAADKLRDAVGGAATDAMNGIERIVNAAKHVVIPNEVKQAVQALSDRLERTDAAIRALPNTFGESEAMLSEIAADALVRAESLAHAWDDCVERAGEALSELDGTFEDLFLQRVDVIEQRFETLVESMAEAIAEQLSAAPIAFVEQLRNDYLAGIEISGNTIESAGEQLASQVTRALEELDTYMRDEFAEALERKVEDMLERVLDGLAEDAFENVTLTQISTTVTTAIAPYLPALMAARALLGAIQSALQAMRMGF
jgi:hypothetical protein